MGSSQGSFKGSSSKGLEFREFGLFGFASERTWRVWGLRFRV